MPECSGALTVIMVSKITPPEPPDFEFTSSGSNHIELAI